MTKKWYNYFVSVDEASPSGEQVEAPPDAAPSSAAQTVADIAASLTPPPKMNNLPGPAASFDEIYNAAEIHAPQHGTPSRRWPTCCKASISATCPREVKRSSILVALEAAGAKIQEVIQDAVRRDRALDTFERVQQKARRRPGGPQDAGKSADPGRDGPDHGRAPRPHPGQQRRHRQGEGAFLSPGGCRSSKRNKKSRIPYLIS